MNLSIEKQVTSFEISKRFKELGVNQDSVWSYIRTKDDFTGDYTNNLDLSKNIGRYVNITAIYSAFTVAELGEMLPVQFTIKTKSWYNLECRKKINGWIIHYDGIDGNGCGHLPIDITAKSEADARGLMLIYLLKNKLIEADK